MTNYICRQCGSEYNGTVCDECYRRCQERIAERIASREWWVIMRANLGLGSHYVYGPFVDEKVAREEYENRCGMYGGPNGDFTIRLVETAKGAPDGE